MPADDVLEFNAIMRFIGFEVNAHLDRYSALLAALENSDSVF